MTTALLAFITAVLTTLAFVLKDAILHFVCVVVWLLFGIAMYNQTWPVGNTYLGLGFLLFALAMVILNLVMALNHYLGLRTTPPTHDEIQNEHRRKILNLTTQTPKQRWWDDTP